MKIIKQNNGDNKVYNGKKIKQIRNNNKNT